MMKGFRYEQSTGVLSIINGDFRCPIADCYAGAPPNINDPDAQCAQGIGPLPRAKYRMRVVEHPRFASPAIKLVPVEGDLCGRSGFFIHGDNRDGNRTASSGCIIADRKTRQLISRAIDAGFSDLIVVI